MRLARAILSLLLFALAAWLFAAAVWLLRDATTALFLPWRSALLVGVTAARIIGNSPAL